MAIAFVVGTLVAAGAHATPFAYVANYGVGTVSVIDTASNALVATVPVGPYPASPALNPAGTRLYVVGLDLVIIDTTTNEVIERLPGIGAPMAFDPSGSRLYLLAGGGGFTPGGHELGQVIVLDTATNTVIAGIPVGLSPRGLAVAAGGLRVYVSNTFDDSEQAHCIYPPPLNGGCVLTLSVIDTTTNSNIGIVQIGPGIQKVASTLTGGRVYVSGTEGVAVVDTGFNQVIARIPGATNAIIVDPTNTRVYATTSNGVEAIDAISNSVTASIVTGYTTSLAITPSGKRLYVTDGFVNTISMVGTLDGTEVFTLPGEEIVIGPENAPITPPPIATATATPLPTETPTVTPGPPGCAGDCNGDGSVTVDEILLMVDIALGNATLSQCARADGNHDNAVTVYEITAAIDAALGTCGVATRSPTPSSLATPTGTPQCGAVCDGRPCDAVFAGVPAPGTCARLTDAGCACDPIDAPTLTPTSGPTPTPGEFCGAACRVLETCRIVAGDTVRGGVCSPNDDCRCVVIQ